MYSSTNNTKQVVWVAIGSFCSFGFSIVSLMILSRYFTKENYGTYKQVIYIYNTLLIFFPLGLPGAFSYFLPRTEHAQAQSLIRKINNLFFLLGGLFSITLFIFSTQIASILKNPDLKEAIRIFAIVPFLLLPTMGLEGILATYKKTMLIAIYNISTNILKLLCVGMPVMIWNLNYNNALVGFVVASFFTFLLALYLKYYPVRHESNNPCNITYKEIFKFSFPLLIASFWGSIGVSTNQFFISRYYGNKVFAEFSNATIPIPFIGMVTGACATVLSPIFSRIHNEKTDCKNEIISLWNSVISKTVMLIYPILLYCLFFADVIMIILYGKQYESSADFFRINLISDFFSIILFGPLIINIGKGYFYSYVLMLNAFLLILLEFISVNVFKNPIAISYVSAFVRLFSFFMMSYCIADYLKIKIYKLFPIALIIKIIIPSILVLSLLHYVMIFVLNLNVFASAILGFCFYSIFYAIYSFVSDINYIKIFKPIFN